MLAAAPMAFDAKMFYVSPNAAPSPLAGKQCNPFFFAVAWPNDAYHEAAGQYATTKGFKSTYLIAPNYQAGKDSLAGFKRFYKGKVAEEVYTKLGQLDFAAELAQVRAAKPDALYIFLPGGMGINFIKQFVAAGLSKDIHPHHCRGSRLRPGHHPARSANRCSASSTPRSGHSDFDNAEPTSASSPTSRSDFKRQPSRLSPRRATTPRCTSTPR